MSSSYKRKGCCLNYSLIVACSKNRVIGINNTLPWRLRDDLKFFKEKTMGHAMVMGRKTFESIGKALPGRRSIVLTRNKSINFPEGVEVVHDLLELGAKFSKDEEVFIIGGAEIYKLFLPMAQTIYLTQVDCEIEGDVFLPKINENNFNITLEQSCDKNEVNDYSWVRRRLDRKGL